MIQLALDGGPKACPDPLPSWPCYDEDEIAAVTAVMRSGRVNQWTGPDVRNFETAFATRFGVPHAIAVANGTLALELALRALGIGPGDEVIVTPRSFFASAGCVAFLGATPVFADVDRDSQNLTAHSIAACIGPKTRAVIPVHLNGWPCDMPAIMALADKHGIFVIEDCAQAHGAEINGQPVGSFGHAAAFSFCQDKIMSTGGEGGMVLLQNEAYWRKAWSLKDHGKDYDAVFHQDHEPGFRWVNTSVGTNWRMPGLQAAIGLKQIPKLDGWVERRREIFQRLAEYLDPFYAARVPMPSMRFKHSAYRFSFVVDPTYLAAGWDRRKIMAAISAEGIACIEPCSAIYRERAFGDLAFPTPNCPVAMDVAEQACLIPIAPNLNDDAVAQIGNAMSKVFAAAERKNRSAVVAQTSRDAAHLQQAPQSF